MISMPLLVWTAWNLFLAALPVALAWLLVDAIRAHRANPSRLGWVVVGVYSVAWLAFLPNSCYLVTEWRHFLFNRYFQEARNIDNPEAFSVYRVACHAGFYLAYSAFGMLCFVASTRIALRGFGLLGFRVMRCAVPLFFLVALGVYLGLVVRFNSWDLVVRPIEVLRVAASALSRPHLLGIVAGFGTVLAGCYLVFDIWMDGLAVRLRSLGLDGARPCPATARV